MTIRQATESDHKYLAQLHMSVFPGFFLSTLGVDFLTTYYKVVLKHPETICLFAEDDNGTVCGYVVGRIKAKGYLRRIVKSAPIAFCWEALKLMFTRPKALIRLVRNLDKKRNDDKVVDHQNYAEIGLIGVQPHCKGQGIGRLLLVAFQQKLQRVNVHLLSLTTDAENNIDTLTAYKAWGFEVLYPFVSYPNRKMLRLIKEVE